MSFGSSLSACKSAPPPFKTIDITDAEYGKGFSLSDPDGKTRTLADFKGRLVMVFFGFTQCPDVCPTALTRAIEVRRQLGKDADKLQVVFITVDPERDTAELLKGYTVAFDPSFLALRGDEAQTRATARDFKVFFSKVPTGSSYTMDHTALSYVFDTAGKLRLAVRHNQTADDIAHDLKILLDAA
ncbi:SCO family protein [Leptothrix discophora]|uniref:SCO family protein n=1 Tax=Leptothrix discophora TaxID=89 RepID=A0ABT9FYY7_LEPDI|nr:SCO family protein [Leptothrix discophora]MDP4299450.1 SCO family protein [Leptothrix discophora]